MKLGRLECWVCGLRNVATLTDAYVCVGDERIPVPRAVVSGLSEFFLKAFTGLFKEAEEMKMLR